MATLALEDESHFDVIRGILVVLETKKSRCLPLNYIVIELTLTTLPEYTLIVPS